MKLLSLLSLAMLMAISSLAATFPAATNAPNTFFFQNTFREPSYSQSPTTNGPNNAEYVTAGWVRGLFNVGTPYYITDVVDPIATNSGPDQPVYTFSSAIPASSIRTYTTANFLTNNGFVGSVITTNRFQLLSGQVFVNSFLAFIGGAAASTLSLHPMIFYSYDRTNWLGGFEGSNESITRVQTNMYTWVISVPTVSSTNSDGFYVQRRFHVESVTGSGVRTLQVFIGTNASSGTLDASHIHLQSPELNTGNAFLAANQTFTGSNTFTKPIADSYGLYPASTNVARLNGTNTFTGPTNTFSGQVNVGTNLTVVPNSATANIKLEAGSANTLVVTNGLVGIGLNPSSVPSKTLTVNGTIGMAVSGVNKWHFNPAANLFGISESGVADNRISIKAGGDVGIGTASPTSKLDVNGTLTASAFSCRTNAWALDTPLPWGTNSLLLVSGAATGGISGFVNFPSGATGPVELAVTATGAVTFTNPPGIYTSDGAKSRVLPAGSLTKFAAEVCDGYTNLVFHTTTLAAP